MSWAGSGSGSHGECTTSANSSPSSFVSIAPGRICLFGEHQDYLGLPVIAAAIPLQCRIEVVTAPNPTPVPARDPSASRTLELIIAIDSEEKTPHTSWKIHLDHLPPSPRRRTPANLKNQPSAGNTQDCDEDDTADGDGDETNNNSSNNIQAAPLTLLDFALAALHEVRHDGWDFASFSGSATCVFTTDLPLQKGCSSSSAFCVAWIRVLARLARVVLTPIEVAQLAHRAEVTHFGHPGGTMDHVTSSVGGVVCVGPGMWEVQSLSSLSTETHGVWILADSGEPKDTIGHLKRCKDHRLAILHKLGGDWDNDPATTAATWSDEEGVLLEATRTNRDMARKALERWTTASASELGQWMNRHHEALRDGLGLSTPRLEAMRQAAMDAGAWGFKLVGSGGGGCGVAWAPPEQREVVAKAMCAAGSVGTWFVNEEAPVQGAHIIYG